MRYLISLLIISASTVSSYSWAASQQGIDTSLLGRARNHEKRQTNCPFNAKHEPAAAYNKDYPYLNAKNGLPGTGKGGIKVPADGDTAHAFRPPTVNDIRGPCPGLNAAANHGFIAHDGITTFTELVDAQQNIWNMGYDLSLILAVIGVLQDGDIVTEKLSIGCDATSRTATLGLGLLGRQPGLNSHSRFETDASLTRNDFSTHNDDNYSFNGTLFARMKDVADRVGGGSFNQAALAAYRSQRYDESVAENPNFFFGPLAILLYGASSFVYELFAPYGSEGTADLTSISSFFGTSRDASGTWRAVPERIPDNWHNRRAPYTLDLGVKQILAQYQPYPKMFGGNIGTNNFNALNFGLIRDGKLASTASIKDTTCLLFQLATTQIPNTLAQVVALPLNLLNWATRKLAPALVNAGCVLNPL